MQNMGLTQSRQNFGMAVRKNTNFNRNLYELWQQKPRKANNLKNIVEDVAVRQASNPFVDVSVVLLPKGELSVGLIDKASGTPVPLDGVGGFLLGLLPAKIRLNFLSDAASTIAAKRALAAAQV